MLKVENLESGYGSMQVLWKTGFEVQRGSITALLGPNGAGKSTMLKTVMGLIEPWRGEIIYEGRDITRLSTVRKVEAGIALVPEGKHLFVNMSAYENLVMGAYLPAAARRLNESLEMVYSLFPILKERSGQKAGLFSGGEQQMLTIARSLMTRPRLIMLDEPGQGLAPKLVDEVFDSIQRMRDQLGLTVVLVEQNIDISLSLADYAYLVDGGTVKARGTPEEIIRSTDIRKAYLGI